MVFKPYPKGNTHKINDSSFGFLTGRSDVVYLKNKYQILIDDKLIEVWNMIHYIEDGEKDLNWAEKQVVAKRSVVKSLIGEENKKLSHIEESLDKVSSNDIQSWETTMKAKIAEFSHTDNIKISPRMRNSDIDTINTSFRSIFPQRYQDGPMKHQETALYNDIKKIRDGISYEKQNYSKLVQKYHFLANDIGSRLIKAKADFEKYKSLLYEGKEKISECQYIKGFLYRISNIENKTVLQLDTTKHDVEKIQATIESLDNKLKGYTIPKSSDGEHSYSIWENE
jgi:hypothetical protein